MFAVCRHDDSAMLNAALSLNLNQICPGKLFVQGEKISPLSLFFAQGIGVILDRNAVQVLLAECLLSTSFR